MAENKWRQCEYDIWLHETIAGQTDDAGWVTVKGHVFGLLALRKVEARLWSVDHLATGWRVAQLEGLLSDAKPVVEQLEAEFNWAFDDPKQATIQCDPAGVRRILEGASAGAVRAPGGRGPRSQDGPAAPP
ncbi:hypothetical protein [Altererythrobacter sp. Root672]|uniref:hypothetical protein n=1 Tax=Altererythrobacter sp. Root672 TaxID=1736584 RepID=UPI0006FCE3DF|nr:hypothetical protein [Altererythrobacter sp. Root672]KRA84220.1 hypothetical protein ASD76_09610 [Altererythrobacter sp. Root672]